MEIKTDKNLQTAFAGESQANRRYLFFADKAEREGHPQVARLFRAVAEAETVHVRVHFTVMDGIGSTKENLLAAVTGEHYEFTRMYPPLIDQAEKEGARKAQRSFEYANEVEKIHHSLFEAALKAVEAGQPLKNEVYFVCQNCGHTVADKAADDACLICGAASSKAFKQVE